MLQIKSKGPIYLQLFFNVLWMFYLLNESWMYKTLFMKSSKIILAVMP